jgi:hypothetical protein
VLEFLHLPSFEATASPDSQYALGQVCLTIEPRHSSLKDL